MRAAVDEVAGAVPVLAPATGSTANAIAQAEAAEAAGADGLLLMPPYLTEASQAGLVEHVSRVCAATGLGVVVYSRANAVLQRRGRRDARRPQPDPDRVQGRRRQHRADDPHLRPGRRPADLHRRPAHRGDLRAAAAPARASAPTPRRSSTSCPQWAIEFYDAVRAQDRDEVYRRLNEFVHPLPRHPRPRRRATPSPSSRPG